MILQRSMFVMFMLALSSVSFAAETSWNAEAGLGYDSNIYRAPDSDYIDYGKVCTLSATPTPTDVCQTRDDGRDHPLVSPTVQSGTFSDLGFEGTYLGKVEKDTDFIADYKFKGRLYLDSNYSNANQYSHSIKVGAKRTFNVSGKKKDSIYVGLLYGQKKKLYLDRDSGDEQIFASQDVSGRYTYDMLGAEVQLKKRTGKIQYKAGAEYQQRDYLNEVVISEYDHDYLRIGGDVSYPLSKITKLTAGYDYTSYDYSDRPSRNIQGRLLTTNPKRKYVYTTIKATVRHRFDKAWLGYFDYERKVRVDDYQAYDDYTKNLVKTRVHYKFNRDTKIKASVAYWERDYSNAYAFDNFIKNIKKSYDGVDANLGFEMSRDKHTSYLARLKYKSENSSDLRYSYDRLRLSFAVAWEY